MIKRFKQPGESDIDAMLRVSLIAAAGAFMLIFFRLLLSLSSNFNELFWLIQALWWFGFGSFFALAWAAFTVAAGIWFRGE